MASNAERAIPKWIKVELMQEVFEEIISGYRQIKEFEVKEALPPGENYATIMLRIKAGIELMDGSIKSCNFMLKTAHSSEMFREMMDRFDMFDIETDMYRFIIPELEQMYTQVGVNHVLKKLAQWPRVTTKGPCDERYMKSYFKPKGFEAMKSMFANVTKYFISCVSSYNGYEEYYEHLCKIEKLLMDELYKVNEIDENDFNALNHGDAWCSNIMFQTDDNDNVPETYLVNYQLPTYGTVAQDLYYFLLSSTKYEIKLKHFDYHENLVKHLRLLNYPNKLPTLKRIHIQLLKHGVWGLTSTCGILAAVLLDPTEKANLDNFVSKRCCSWF
uniref:CHK domain-containing protein n=1 Tax=Glossina brevipalpis TaxID=37001 RepID=A0A1A9W6R6_9MUSC